MKFFLETDHWKEKISFTTTTTSGEIKVTDQETNRIKVLINARVQTEPGTLEKLIDEVLAKAAHIYHCTIVTEKWSVFKPGYPRPTHRME